MFLVTLGTLQNHVSLRFAHLETAYLEALQCLKNKDFYCFLLCFRFPNHKTRFTWMLVPWCWISTKTITTKEFKHCDSKFSDRITIFFRSFRCEISGFCLLSFCQNERTYLCSVCLLFEESVFIFQFLKDKIFNYVLFDIIVSCIIQKLKVDTLSERT